MALYLFDEGRGSVSFITKCPREPTCIFRTVIWFRDSAPPKPLLGWDCVQLGVIGDVLVNIAGFIPFGVPAANGSKGRTSFTVSPYH